MTEQFKVVGMCRVAGIAPGDTVSREVLEKAGANIDALIGPHLEPVDSGATAKTKTKAESEKS